MKITSVIRLWLISKVFILLVLGLAVYNFSLDINKILFQWDAVWYLNIAKFGYDSKEVLVFPPLYPFFARIINSH